MGIGVAQLEHLIHLRKNHPEIMTGEILQLGRQDTYFSLGLMINSFHSSGIKIKQNDANIFRKNEWVKEGESVSDIFLFKSIGFDEVSSMDYVDDKEPTYVHDLNNPAPHELHQKFDAILDGGTMEHVFDTASVFRNIHTMLKPGGVVIHESPTNNFVDHGFWQMSPTLFADAYATNGYTMLEFMVVKMTQEKLHSGPYDRFTYEPKGFASHSIGGHGAEMMGTFCAFKKGPTHEKWLVPQQGFYNKLWGQKVS